MQFVGGCRQLFILYSEWDIFVEALEKGVAKRHSITPGYICQETSYSESFRLLDEHK